MNGEVRNGLILAALASSLGASEPKAKISVMVYNYAAIQPDALAQTKREAASIYEHAGIVIEWLDCALSPKEAALFPACRIEVGPAKLAIRLVPQVLAGYPPHAEDVLGFAMMPADGSFAMIANIFTDETEHLAKHLNGEIGANLKPGTLLGVVVAHELGHLLLGPGSHAHVGIMCAHWQRKELKLILERVMTFTPGEAESLRKSVRARIAAEAAMAITFQDERQFSTTMTLGGRCGSMASFTRKRCPSTVTSWGFLLSFGGHGAKLRTAGALPAQLENQNAKTTCDSLQHVGITFEKTIYRR